MSTQTRVTLPDSLMAIIRAAAASGEVDDFQLLEGAALAAFGYGLFDEHPRTKAGNFDPSTIAIPAEQSREIMGLLQSRQKGNGLAAVNLALSWMNSGPSAWEPEPEPEGDGDEDGPAEDGWTGQGLYHGHTPDVEETP